MAKKKGAQRKNQNASKGDLKRGITYKLSCNEEESENWLNLLEIEKQNSVPELARSLLNNRVRLKRKELKDL